MSKPQKETKNEFLEMDDTPPASGQELAPVAAAGPLAAPRREWYDPSDKPNQDERVIPFMKLAQDLSVEVKELKTAEVGDMSSSLGIKYGKWVHVIPLWFKRQAAYFNRQRKLECFSLDGIHGSRYGACAGCQYSYAKWTKDEKGERRPPVCAKVMSFPAIIVRSELFPDHGMEQLGSLGIVNLQFMKTSEPVGRQIASIRAAFNEPYYSGVWELTSRDKKFDAGTAKIYVGKQVGKVPEEAMLICERMCREWGSATLQVGVDEPTAEDLVGAGLGGGARPEDM